MGVVDSIVSGAKLFQEAGKMEEYKEILNLLEQTRKQGDEIYDLKKEIKNLEDKLEIKGKLELRNNFYYVDGKGPYCINCWDVKKLLVNSIPTYLNSNYAECANCKNTYNYTGIDDDSCVVNVDHSEYL